MFEEQMESSCGCPLAAAVTFHLGRQAGVAYRGGFELGLTAIEFRVFQTLVLARGRTVGAEEIVASVRGDVRVGCEAAARQWIRGVRRKVGSPDPVRTIFCGGYAWNPAFAVSVCDRPAAL
ncbi:helix-turn-helix domain-containing protein [Nocardioides sp.]|uniref:helix-turn-helix domain-containing protein n=1 Tax=Nocardioides sp. TaxID=35761 RepID=UPI003D099B9D